MSKFQVVLLSLFGFFILTAVLVFAFYRGGSESGTGSVTVWGSISSSDFNTFYANSEIGQDQSVAISYVEKLASSLTQEFTQALARGEGPDLIILSQEDFFKEKGKLIPIPYQSISEQAFQTAFIEAGEIFLTEEGIYALPLIADPLVLYYNRDILSSAGIAKPISYWDELYSSTLVLTKRDAAGNIVQSAIALGETRNMNRSKDILSLLFLQAGNSITGFFGPDLRSRLAESFNLPVPPADSALDFYTQFSNPSKPYYSWNRALPEAQTNFASGDAAYYLGFASELSSLRGKNPTLNFAVSPVPQSRVSGEVITFGKLYGVAVSRGARDQAAAIIAASKLVSSESAASLAKIMNLPPARRDLLAAKPTDAVLPVFYDAALQMEAWIDPDALGTKAVWNEMIESVTSGRSRTREAVNKASAELDKLIK
jgi:multiple sugar transport system substrate-binding protein